MISGPIPSPGKANDPRRSLRRGSYPALTVHLR